MNTLRHSKLMSHLAGCAVALHLLSPLDNILPLPWVSSLSILGFGLLILSLGAKSLIRVASLTFIFALLGSLALRDLHLYALKSSVAIAFFLGLFRERFQLDGQVLLKYLTFVCLGLLFLMLIGILQNLNLLFLFFQEFRPTYFLFKDIDVYKLNSALKFQWLLGDPKAAQSVFTGITLFFPIFIWLIVSIHLKHTQLFIFTLSLVPLLVLYSRGALLFFLMYSIAKVKKARTYVFLGAFALGLFFYYSAFNYFPGLLRGREHILKIISLETQGDSLFFGSGPGFIQNELENFADHGSIHNLFIEWFVSYGIIGFCLLLFIFVVYYWNNKSPSLYLGMTVLLSFGLFNFNIGDISFLCLTVVLMKLANASNNSKIESKLIDND